MTEKVFIKGKGFKIGENSYINCETFKVGKFCCIGKNVRITCKEFVAGDFLFIKDNAEIGHGGQFNDESIFNIGDGCFIGERATINTARKITIGNEVGIGDDVKLWTHGSYLNILDGFPSKFDSLTIGSNVWIQAMTHVMPGLTIEDNSVILCGSIITKNVPKGSLVGGNPAKIIKENLYPKTLSDHKKAEIVNNLILKWMDSLGSKLNKIPFKFEKVLLNDEGLIARFIDKDNIVLKIEIDINTRKYFNYDDRYERIFEDLRDFLRRNGIRIMTDKPFLSMSTLWSNK